MFDTGEEGRVKGARREREGGKEGEMEAGVRLGMKVMEGEGLGSSVFVLSATCNTSWGGRWGGERGGERKGVVKGSGRRSLVLAVTVFVCTVVGPESRPLNRIGTRLWAGTRCCS